MRPRHTGIAAPYPRGYPRLWSCHPGRRRSRRSGIVVRRINMIAVPDSCSRSFRDDRKWRHCPRQFPRCSSLLQTVFRPPSQGRALSRGVRCGGGERSSGFERRRDVSSAIGSPRRKPARPGVRARPPAPIRGWRRSRVKGRKSPRALAFGINGRAERPSFRRNGKRNNAPGAGPALRPLPSRRAASSGTMRTHV